MKRSISNKAKKVIEKGIEELTSMSSLEGITRIGAQMICSSHRGGSDGIS